MPGLREWADSAHAAEGGAGQAGATVAGSARLGAAVTDGLQTRFAFGAVDEAGFAAYHADNPHVYATLKRFALEAVQAGRTHIGIAMLYERMRWFTLVEAKQDTFKVNNNWRAFYARKLMAEEPALAGLFETRTSRRIDGDSGRHITHGIGSGYRPSVRRPPNWRFIYD